MTKHDISMIVHFSNPTFHKHATYQQASVSIYISSKTVTNQPQFATTQDKAANLTNSDFKMLKYSQYNSI